MAGIVMKDPAATLAWLQQEWNKVKGEELIEKRAEASELRTKTEDKECQDSLRRIRLQIEEKISEFAGVLKSNLSEPVKKNKALLIMERIRELLGQYRYTFNRLKSLERAEQNIAKLETQTLEQLRDEFEKIDRALHHTP
jgi:anaerobic ribonucleoside-triphosphate reductase